MNIKGQGHSLSVVQGHSDSTSSNFFSSKNTRPIEAKFYIAPPLDIGMKIYLNVPGHTTKMASRSICVKIKFKKKLLLRNQEADDFEIWYTALGTQVLPNLFK